MALNSFDEEQFEPEMEPVGEPSPTPSKKPSNRNFFMAIGIIGVILILALVLLLLVAPSVLQQQRNNPHSHGLFPHQDTGGRAGHQHRRSGFSAL
jgi:hypothetical protein